MDQKLNRKIKIAQQHLALIQYSFELNDLLNQSGIDFVFIKGFIFKEMFYGVKSDRSSSDIDILIRKQDLDKVSNLLLAEGFEYNAQSELPLRYQIAYNCELSFVKEEHARIAVEPHWNICRPFLHLDIDYDAVKEAKIAFAYSGRELPTLSPEWMVVITLLHHGGGDMWLIKRHLEDIHQILTSQSPPLDWYEIYRISAKYDILWVIAVSLAMSHCLYQDEIPVPFAQVVKDSKIQNTVQERLKLFRENQKGKEAIDMRDRLALHLKHRKGLYVKFSMIRDYAWSSVIKKRALAKLHV